MVTDDVWDRLGRGAGTATRGEIRRVRAVFAALLAGVLLALAGWVSGAAVPRLSYRPGSLDAWVFQDGDGLVRRPVVRLPHMIVNDGWFPVTVTGAGLRADGARLVEVREDEGRAFPLTVRPGGRIELTFAAEVLDCGRAAAAVPEPLLRVERWWGSQTVNPAEETDVFWVYGVESACER
ncbi:hypothetical protein [Nonomuraea sp. NPDC048826]|uniref:hypothetical protein n=1 Tax=Nonomuraea sp. NPDC048826 TaxID=3364347 RepID=UPI00371E941B